MTNKCLSPVILGTMRLSDKGLTVKDCGQLFQIAIDSGVNTFHISSEYSSFELVSAVFRSMPSSYKSKVSLVAKVASPHFDESTFDKENLNKKLDLLLKSLNVDTIDVAQWMWRQSPMDDADRIPKLLAAGEVIKESFSQIINSGKTSEFGCFPYTAEFMKEARAHNISNLHINYLNFWEDNLLEGEVGERAIALRPYFAGKSFSLTKEQEVKLSEIDQLSPMQHALAFPLSHPSIKSVVVGINNVEQLTQAVKAAEMVKKDINTFEAYKGIELGD